MNRKSIKKQVLRSIIDEGVLSPLEFSKLRKSFVRNALDKQRQKEAQDLNISYDLRFSMETKKIPQFLISIGERKKERNLSCIRIQEILKSPEYQEVAVFHYISLIKQLEDKSSSVRQWSTISSTLSMRLTQKIKNDLLIPGFADVLVSKLTPEQFTLLCFELRDYHGPIISSLTKLHATELIDIMTEAYIRREAEQLRRDILTPDPKTSNNITPAKILTNIETNTKNDIKTNQLTTDPARRRLGKI